MNIVAVSQVFYKSFTKVAIATGVDPIDLSLIRTSFNLMVALTGVIYNKKNVLKEVKKG